MKHDAPAAACAAAPHGGLPIAAFVLGIVGTCLGLAALSLAIVNAVRLGRMKKRLDARDAEPSSTPQMARESAARTEVASSSASHPATNPSKHPTTQDGAAGVDPATASVFHPAAGTPYYACIFASILEGPSAPPEGCLGMDRHARDAGGRAVMVTYWPTEEAALRWQRKLQVLAQAGLCSDCHVHVTRAATGSSASAAAAGGVRRER